MIHLSTIIEAESKYLEPLTKMAHDLWPEHTYEELYKEMEEFLRTDQYKFLLHIENGVPNGFIQLSLRTDYVEGAETSPTGYIEGIYVKPEYRRKGIARKLVAEGEKWFKAQGCRQVGSDIYIDNQTSYEFHTGIGFQEAGRLIAFIKNLD